jgi:hypothetical protein
LKRRTWKWVLGTVGSILAVTAGVYLDALRRAERTLERHRISLAERAARFDGMDRRRPPAFGPAREGNAWEHYGPAFDAIGAIPNDLADAIPEIEGTVDPRDVPPDEHLLENLFLEHAAQFEAIRKGARSRLVDPGLVILDGPGMRLPHITNSIRASRFITGALTHAWRLGREGEALELAALGLAMAQDIGRGRLLVYSLVQIVCEGIPIYAVRDLLANHSLSAEELSSFAARLDRLDASRPDLMESWPGEDLWIRSALCSTPWEDFERGGWVPSKSTPIHPTWRCLFSQRITRAQALSIHASVFDHLTKLAGVPSWQRESECLAWAREAESWRNPLVDRMLPAFGRTFQRDALALVQRALLRVSVAIAWFEAEQGRYPKQLEELVPRYLPRVPLCPFTGLPLVTRDGKVWSVGANRVDDGGVLDPREPEDGGTGDIVWIVKRK